MKLIPLFVALSLVAHSSARAEVAAAVVTDVHDGDTFTAVVHGTPERVRLNAIDAPEITQPYGIESRDNLRRLLLGKTVTLNTLPRRDIYGRIVATVYVDQVDECLAQVRDGAAWVFTKYISKLRAQDRATYLLTQTLAHDQRRGLWSNNTPPEAPWTFRKEAKAAALAKKPTR